MNWYKKAQIDSKYLIELFNLLHLKYKNSNVDYSNPENPILLFGYNEGVMFNIYYDQKKVSIVIEKRIENGWQDLVAAKQVAIDGNVSRLNEVVEAVSEAIGALDEVQ